MIAPNVKRQPLLLMLVMVLSIQMIVHYLRYSSCLT